MKIKRRTISTTISKEAAVKMLTTAFPLIEAKPKEPLPEPNIVDGFIEDGGNPHRLGAVAIACTDETKAQSADDGFNAGDYVALLRTPLDPNNNTEKRYRARIRNRATAITGKCVDCVGSRKNVTECAAVTCPLWAFRLGTNPFRRR